MHTSAKNKRSKYQELYFNNRDKKSIVVASFSHNSKLFNIDLYVNDGDYTVVSDSYGNEYCAFTVNGYCIINACDYIKIGKISIGNNANLVFNGNFYGLKIYLESNHNPNKQHDAYFRIETEIASWILTNLSSVLNYEN